MTSVTTNVFFYGLFMDAALLETNGVRSGGSRSGIVPNWGLRIGERATIVPAVGEVVYGMVTEVPLPDLERLYADPSVQMYRPAAVLVDGAIAALAYVLPEQPQSQKTNSVYAAQLRALAERLGFPVDYTETIR